MQENNLWQLPLIYMRREKSSALSRLKKTFKFRQMSNIFQVTRISKNISVVGCSTRLDDIKWGGSKLNLRQKQNQKGVEVEECSFKNLLRTQK